MKLASLVRTGPRPFLIVHTCNVLCMWVVYSSTPWHYHGTYHTSINSSEVCTYLHIIDQGFGSTLFVHVRTFCLSSVGFNLRDLLPEPITRNCSKGLCVRFNGTSVGDIATYFTTPHHCINRTSELTRVRQNDGSWSGSVPGKLEGNISCIFT